MSPGSGMQRQQNVEQKALDATERVAEKAQTTFDNVRSRVAEQFNAVGRAMSTATQELRNNEHDGLSRRVEQVARKAEDAAQYLRSKSPRELKDDLERFARQRPAWFLGGALLVGLLGVRFLKSSARNTNDMSSSMGGNERLSYGSTY